MKRLLFLATIIASIFIINNLLQSIYNLWRKHDLLVKAQRDLVKEREKNKELAKQLRTVNDPLFIEKEARNKLFMVKEGERPVVIPTALLTATRSGETKKEAIPMWQKWFRLFF